MLQPLFKRKTNRAKKGIQAIVLLSTAASLPAFPGLFLFLPMDIVLKKLFKQEQKPVLPAIGARRAQSMSILPAKLKFDSEDELDNGFKEFEAEAAGIEARRSALLLAMDQNEGNQNEGSSPRLDQHRAKYSDSRYPGQAPPGQDSLRYPGLSPNPTKLNNQLANRTQPLHPKRSRRIQSAPSVALRNLPVALLDDLDAWETDAFTLNDWVVPEVREKAMRQQRSQEIEDWDGDFEVEDEGGVEIPIYMKEIQMKFKSDMLHMRQFALHIEDLKLIHENSIVLKNSVKKEFEEDVEMIEIGAEEMLKQIMLLIRLADWQEEQGPSLSQDDFKRLSAILCRSDLLQSSSLNFGNEVMVELLEKISPLKKDLVNYISQIRDLMSC